MDTNNELEAQKAKAIEAVEERFMLEGYGYKAFLSNVGDGVLFARVEIEVKGKVTLHISDTSIYVYDGKRQTYSQKFVIPSGYSVASVHKKSGAISIDLVKRKYPHLSIDL